MKWLSEDGHGSFDWMELQDSSGSPLPYGEYGVALVAHRCKVEFGPVDISVLGV
jgi:hypothetical protein